jgi:general secretion pathway protein C
MARYVSWFANLSLGALACFLLAQSINTVLEALLAPAPLGEIRQRAAEAPTAGERPDPQIILTRNLFNASTLAPAPGSLAAEPEVLEATQLPLTLLGTAAAEIPDLSWAAVEDRESQQTLVLRVGDSVRNQAQVRRIERKRIVLEERGTLRELALEEPEDLASSPAPRPVTAARSRPRGPRVTPPQMAAPREEGIRSPAQLFSEARILPKYEAGQMVGVQVSAIKPGSLFEKMGIQDGDTITELNGMRIDSPEQSAKILLELTRSDAFTVQVEGAGGTRTLDIDLPEP